MNVISYVQLDLMAVLICIMIFYFQRHHETRVLPKELFYIILLQLSIISMVDAASRIIIDYADSVGTPSHALFVAQTILLFLYNVLQCSLPMSLFKCCIKMSGIRIGFLRDVAISTPFLVTLVAMIVNIFVPIFYRATESGSYERLNGFLYTAIIPGLYVLVCEGLAIGHCVKSTPANISVRRKMLIFSTLTLLGTVLGMVIYDVAIWPLMALNVTYLFITVQNTKNAEAKDNAFRDALTGLRNAASYRHHLFGIDEKIKHGTAKFGVAVMDVTGLKNLNDTYGHDVGDLLITTATKFICDIYKHSPVFRVGGDEFVVILEGEDYRNREELKETFFRGIDSLTVSADGEDVPVIVAMGMAIYKPEKEMHYADVFKIADRRMYECKKIQKGLLEDTSPIYKF